MKERLEALVEHEHLIETGFQCIERAQKEGILEKFDSHAFYLNSKGEPEAVFPVVCSCDPKDNLRNFLRQERRLGLAKTLRDLLVLQFAGGPLTGSEECGWIGSSGHEAREYFYLQIQLMHGATGRNRFPFISHFPCRVCMMYKIGFFYELAQLHDAVASFHRRYTGMELSTVPCFDVDSGTREKPNTTTYFANRHALKEFMDTIAQRGKDGYHGFFRNEREWLRACRALNRAFNNRGKYSQKFPSS